MSPQPIVASSVVIIDVASRVLLIRRGHEPGLGLWSLPGGSAQPGESPREAAAREALEETGLVVEIGRRLVTLPVELGPRQPYLVHCFRAHVVHGELRAGDDAAEALWCDSPTFRGLATTPRLGEILALAGWPENAL